MSMSDAEIFLAAHLNALSPAIRAAVQSVLAELKETKEKIAMLEGKNSANLSGEVWRDVAGFEGTYQVSNKGRIKSFHYGREKILSPFERSDGYLSVWLQLNKSKQYFTVHRLVAETFIQNPENLPVVNHIDGNKQNNCVENLEWVTHSDNEKHAYKIGLMKVGVHMRGGVGNCNAKFTAEQIRFIRKNYKPRDSEFGQMALAKKFGVHRDTIQKIIQGETYREG